MSNARTLASTINSSSEIVVPSGGVNFGTSTDGSGTVTSGVLDDYEEGTWTPTLTNVTLGNASIGQNIYVKIGTLVYLSVNITFGSTTTFSSGDIRINNSSLPFTPSTNGHGSAWLFDSGAAFYLLPAVIPTSTTLEIKIASTATAQGDDITNTAPFTWAANDRINLSLTYATS